MANQEQCKIEATPHPYAPGYWFVHIYEKDQLIWSVKVQAENNSQACNLGWDQLILWEEQGKSKKLKHFFQGFADPYVVKHVDDVREFFVHLIYQLLISIHPDDDFGDLINNQGNEFMDETEVRRYNTNMADAHEICRVGNKKTKFDIYEIACSVLGAFLKAKSQTIVKRRDWHGGPESLAKFLKVEPVPTEQLERMHEEFREQLHQLTGGHLVAAVRGDLDLDRIVRDELVNRGFGLDGKWIGFPEAHSCWKDFRFNKDGRFWERPVDNTLNVYEIETGVD